jgi:hypothetical protein
MPEPWAETCNEALDIADRLVEEGRATEALPIIEKVLDQLQSVVESERKGEN